MELGLILGEALGDEEGVSRVGTKPSVRTPVSTYELEDFSKPLNQDTDADAGWITVKHSRKPSLFCREK
jgi:hypothetical protein